MLRYRWPGRYHAFIFKYIYVVSTLGQMMGLPGGLTSANY